MVLYSEMSREKYLADQMVLGSVSGLLRITANQLLCLVDERKRPFRWAHHLPRSGGASKQAVACLYGLECRDVL